MEKIKIFFDVRCFEGLSRKESRRGAFWAILNMLRVLARRGECELKIVDSSGRNLYEVLEILKEFDLSAFAYPYSKKDFLLTYPRYRTKSANKGGRTYWRIVEAMANLFNKRKNTPLSLPKGSVYFTAGAFGVLPKKEGVLRCAFVWDMIPLVAPELTEGKRNKFLESIRNNPNQFDLYFADSESAKNDIVNITKIDPRRVHVSFLGCGKQLDVNLQSNADKGILGKFGLKSEKYVISVSSYEKRKNFEKMICAFIMAAKKLKLEGVKFVIVGDKQWKLRDSLKQLILKGELLTEDLEKYVIKLGYVTSEEIVAISNNALFMAYVSLYEGFGLPALDAMQMGIPVLTSNVSSLPEVVGDAAITVNPYSVEDIAMGFELLFTNKDLRDRLRIKGYERAKLFTWDLCVDRMIDVMGKQVSGNRYESK